MKTAITLQLLVALAAPAFAQDKTTLDCHRKGTVIKAMPRHDRAADELPTATRPVRWVRRFRKWRIGGDSSALSTR
jgi:hypothetical protein